MKILGVDVGSSSVKVAELDVNNKGFALTNVFEFPLSLDPNKDQGLEVIDQLRTLAAKYEAKDTKWVIGVSQDRVSIHNNKFPFRERQKILKSLAFELEDEIPFDIDDTIFDAKIIEFTGPMTDILTIACPKDVVRETLELAGNCDFDPEIVGIEGLALANLYSDWDTPPRDLPLGEVAGGTPGNLQKARLVLHIGHKRSNLLVFRGGALINVRSILWGGEDVTTALANAFKMQVFEASKTLREKSFILMNSSGASREQVQLSKTISTSVDQLVRELGLTLLELRTKFQIDFERIELTGGLSQIQNIVPYITAALAIPASIAEPVLDPRQMRIEMDPHMTAIAGVAIGLAIEGVKRPSIPAVNLRREEFARENEALTEILATWKLPAQIALTAFVILCVYSMVRDTMATNLLATVDARMTEFATKVAGLKGNSATETGVKNYINKQKKLIADRKELDEVEGLNSAFDILARLSEKMPVQKPPQTGLGFDVTHLSIDYENVVIEGRAAGPSVILAIEHALQGIAVSKADFKKAPSHVGPGTGVAFAYQIKVNRK